MNALNGGASAEPVDLKARTWCDSGVLYMLNGFLTSRSLWNGQSRRIALAECALEALEYILPAETESNGERVREREENGGVRERRKKKGKK